MNSDKRTLFNPFPGLRPFEEDEEHLFFGREKSVTELLSRLRTNRFLAVIGTSGSGKSSLVKSGLLPSIYRGFMAGAGSAWRVATFRPGENPIGHLASALTGAGVLAADPQDNEKEEDAGMASIRARLMETTLRRSPRGLVDAVKQARLPQHENLLVVVDQFEELFRFSKMEQTMREVKRDSVAFIQLLLQACRQSRLPIYVLLTMRTDFLGDCTAFRGLPEAVNDGQYLVPRMNREERKAAVTGPIAVGGASITPTLLSRLLNDVGENPDQLPILQHALMRTWDYWENNGQIKGQESEAIDIPHYEAIGAMDNALSFHAEEAFAELKSDDKQLLCEKLFKLLTDVDDTGRGVRRPAKVKEICRATGASTDEIIEVIDVFRRPGRTFLMPPIDVALEMDSIIDISHESFMRIWDRLMDWVREEGKSAELYQRLAKAATLHNEGEAALLRDPELMLALKWKKEQLPTEQWAHRYNPSFTLTMDFLGASKRQQDLEIEAKEKAQKAKIRASRILAAVISVAAIVSLIFTFWAVKNKQTAEVAHREAVKQRQRAFKERINALKEKARAEKARDEAREAQKESLKNEQEAERAKKEAEKAREEAVASALLAKKNQIKAELKEKEANQNALRALIKGLIVDMNKEDAYFRQLQSKAAELAAESVSFPIGRNNAVKTLLAITAYKMNLESYGILGKRTDRIFNAFRVSKMKDFKEDPEIQEIYAKALKQYRGIKNKSLAKQTPGNIFEAMRNAYVSRGPLADVLYSNIESWAMTALDGNRVVFNFMDGSLLVAPFNYGKGTWPVINPETIMDLWGPSMGGPVLQASVFATEEGKRGFFCGTMDGVLVHWQSGNRRIGTLPVKIPTKGKGKILDVALAKKSNVLFYSIQNRLYKCDLPAQGAASGKNLSNKPVFAFQGADFIRTITVVEDPNSTDFFLILGDRNGDTYRGALSGTVMNLREIGRGEECGDSAFYAAAYEPHRKWLAMGDMKGNIYLADNVDFEGLAAGKQLGKMRVTTKHKGIVKDLLFSPGGKYLASVGFDGSIFLWSLENKQRENIIKEKPDLVIENRQKVLSLLFDEKENFLLYADERRLRVCPTRPELLYELLCKRNKKTFTAEEWNSYVGDSIKPEDIDLCGNNGR